MARPFPVPTPTDLQDLPRTRDLPAATDRLDRDALLAQLRDALPSAATADEVHAAMARLLGGDAAPAADRQAAGSEPGTPPPRDAALKLLTELADALPVGVCAVTQDLQMILFNRAARTLLQFPDSLFEDGLPSFPELVLFNARRGEYGPGEPQALADTILERARRMEPHHVQRTRPDGTVLDIRGAPMRDGGFCTIWTDVTALVQAQAELRRQAHELRELIDSAPGTIGFIDRDGVVRLANRRLVALYGHAEAADVEGRPVRELLGADRYAVAGPLLERALDGEPLDYRRELTAADGTSTWLQVYLEPCRAEGGSVRGVFAVGVDITPLVASERAQQERNAHLAALNARLEDAQSQLMQSERLASIGQLAAGVAHEINNPVGFVASNTHTLGRYVDDLLALVGAYEATEPLLPADAPERMRLMETKANADLDFLREDVRDLLAQSRDGLQRVKKIVQDLKDFSRADTAHRWEPADIEQCLESTLNIALNEIKYKARLVREYGHPPPVECIPSQLNQVLLNLVVNAGQAIDQQGTITVRTGSDDAGDEVWIDVEDTGCGMDEHTLQRIYEPFFTTKPVGQGTGLGLSLAYGIVQRHRGRLDVRSEVGVGTRFRLWLPVSQPAAA